MSVLVPLAGSLSSADGILAMLDEPDYAIKAYAMQQLAQNVDVFWHEISEAIQRM